MLITVDIVSMSVYTVKYQIAKEVQHDRRKNQERSHGKRYVTVRIECEVWDFKVHIGQD